MLSVGLFSAVYVFDLRIGRRNKSKNARGGV